MQSLFDRAFVEPFSRLAEQLMQVLAPLAAVTVILLGGALLASLVRRVTHRLLVTARFDRLAENAGISNTILRTGVFRSPSDFAARILQGIVWLWIVLFALSAADTQVTESLVTRFVNYVPDLVTAALLLLLGSVISKFLARSALLAAVNAQMAGARLIAGGVRMLVMMLAVVMALEQLRIGRAALLVAFAILFGGIIVAGAIAFGLGARDLAKEWMQSKLHAPRPEPGEEDEVLRHL